jgi:lysophospholipid acyltransferase (LPLAT)-like uncharacterized protein
MKILSKIYLYFSSQGLKLLLRLISPTLKVKVHGIEDLHENAIFAFWHNSTFVIFHANPVKKMAILVADGPRGEIFTEAVKDYGNKIIRVPFGNEPRQAALSAKKTLDAIDDGYNVGIAVDGPNGPRYDVKPGIFFLSERSGKKIVPVGIAVSKKIVIPFRWDGYYIPWPFSKAVLYLDTGFNSSEPAALRMALLEAGNKAAKSVL